MKRKVSVLIMLSLLSVTLFAGGQQDSGENSVPYELTPNGTYPVVTEKVELTVFTPAEDAVIDFATNDFTTWLEEKTNVHIIFETGPVDAVKEKITLLLASGDYPDIFMRSYLDINPAMEARFGIEEEIFIPLNDLIRDHAPNFNKILEENPKLLGSITHLDGNIYSLPRVNDCYHCSMPIKMWVNKTWIDKAGLDMPETTEDFYEMLTAFKDMDMNGNGDTADEIPLAGAREREGWYETLDSFLMSPFIQDNGDRIRLLESNGEISSIVNTAEYKEGLKYLARLFDEDLIYAPSFTQKHDQLRQLANYPDILVGAFQAGHNQMLFNATADPERYGQYVALPPLKGPDGTRQTAYFPYNAYRTGQFLITDKCEDPEVAMRWIDSFYTVDAAIRESERGGVEGVHFRWAEPDEVGINGKPAIYKSLVKQSIEPRNFNWLNGTFYSRDFRLGKVKDPNEYGYEEFLYDTTKDLYSPYINPEVRIAPPLKLTTEEADQLSTIKVELQNYIESSKTKFIMGEDDIEKNWDKYISDLENIGLGSYLEVMQTAYNRQF
ncbi:MULTISPECIES: extracellular solute-binding protein [unclassified Oceanispirochaeta]|uniref:extracellular solute-binding protein n=1 Tax=unclassified Oceanispirochaeta TaxID=2635722 RepID=UPI0013148553|nr:MULTISPECIES: extracellular solute-binding protein [unclassified Oceanispirochaeta]MBF9015524.1 extracellular solute-binding protein [Oceanispirochaeta sp. M2]NPD71983.1 extracellular solute-binding protein [Oceanispirochaeta sp. M1]